jgi:hypothetical protein
VVNPEDPDDPDDPNNPDINDGDNDGVLTVAQAIAAKTDQEIWVQGYIVGTTRQSLEKTKYDGILTDFTAIVLADEPGTTDKKILFPIGLKKETRQILAEYGNELINMKVKVKGYKHAK